jgi:hypothetical protein
VDTGPVQPPSASIPLGAGLFGQQLLPGTIAPRAMRWFLVNADELEQFKKMDTGSSQNLAFGMLAIGIAASFFGSRYTVAGDLTLHQIALFQIAPAIIGPIGLLWTWRGLRELTGMTRERAAHIERIRSQSGVITRTEVSPVRPSEELLMVVKETAQVDLKGPDV